MDTQKLILDHIYVQFDGNYYHQHEGLPMGTPSAPSIANVYLAYFEKSLMEENLYLSKCIVRCYRYIDDMSLCIRHYETFNIEEFLSTLKIEPGIEWNLEAGPDKEVDFLDLKISIETYRFKFRTFKKS